MAFSDLHSIRRMFREFSRVDEIEEAYFQEEMWRRGWYWRMSDADRELVKQRQRSYAKQPDVRDSRNDWQRRYKQLERWHGTQRGREIWRERRAAGEALNALAVPA